MERGNLEHRGPDSEQRGPCREDVFPSTRRVDSAVINETVMNILAHALEHVPGHLLSTRFSLHFSAISVEHLPGVSGVPDLRE